MFHFKFYQLIQATFIQCTVLTQAGYLYVEKAVGVVLLNVKLHHPCSTDPEDTPLQKATAPISEASHGLSRLQPPNAPNLQQRSSPLGMSLPHILWLWLCTVFSARNNVIVLFSHLKVILSGDHMTLKIGCVCAGREGGGSLALTHKCA